MSTLRFGRFGYQILPIFGHLELKLNSLPVYVCIFYKWHIYTCIWSLGPVDGRLGKKKNEIGIIMVILVVRFGLTVPYLFSEIYMNCTCLCRIENTVVCIVCLCYNRPFDETSAVFYGIIQ